MEYATIELKYRDINEEGIALKPSDIVIKNERITSETIAFTLKKNIRENPNSFLFKGDLYMVEKRDDKYFECIAIDIKRVK